MRQAPSRIENSEWTWRWTKGGASGTAEPLYEGVPTGPSRGSEAQGEGRERDRAADRSAQRARRARLLDEGDAACPGRLLEHALRPGVPVLDGVPASAEGVPDVRAGGADLAQAAGAALNERAER